MKRHSTTAPSYFRWAEAKGRDKKDKDRRPAGGEDIVTIEGYLVVEFEPGKPAPVAVYGHSCFSKREK
jgi:hypothetical protein